MSPPPAENQTLRSTPARLTRTITVNDAALRQIVWRKLHVDAVAWKNFDVMAAQAAGNVRQNDVTVIQLDGKRRAWKNLLYATVDLQRGLAVVDCGV